MRPLVWWPCFPRLKEYRRYNTECKEAITTFQGWKVGSAAYMIYWSLMSTCTSERLLVRLNLGAFHWIRFQVPALIGTAGGLRQGLVTDSQRGVLSAGRTYALFHKPTRGAAFLSWPINSQYRTFIFTSELTGSHKEIQNGGQPSEGNILTQRNFISTNVLG